MISVSQHLATNLVTEPLTFGEKYAYVSLDEPTGIAIAEWHGTEADLVRLAMHVAFKSPLSAIAMAGMIATFIGTISFDNYNVAEAFEQISKLDHN